MTDESFLTDVPVLDFQIVALCSGGGKMNDRGNRGFDSRDRRGGGGGGLGGGGRNGPYQGGRDRDNGRDGGRDRRR